MAKTVNVAELNAELEKGYADMAAGRTKPVKQVFTDWNLKRNPSATP